MPPKKAQKMSLNEFLGDSALGSWADEMDALPTAPAARADDDRSRSGLGDRRRDDYMSSRPDRGPSSFREDLPLPTEPPYTAFVGNLAFDLTEMDLETFFAGHQTKSVKIIKDREDKPKGFGYVEFIELDGLKDALTKSGTTLAGRAVRISVAEPPKERSGFGGSGGFDDDKFAGNWRRDGPLPELSSREAPRRRFDGPSPREPPPPSVSDNISDWRSNRPPVRSSPGTTNAELDGPSFKRRGSGFRSQDGGAAGPADTEEHWAIGSKFKAGAPPEGPGSRFGGARGKSDTGFSATSTDEDHDWRRPRTLSRNSTSPGDSVPPTPQMGRRKLELLPRSSTSTSGTPSPLASPNPANPTAHPHHPRTNPFGAAKPVDTLAKEEAIAARLEKDREQVKERISHHSMSRTSSKNASHRGEARTGHAPTSSTPTSPRSPKAEPRAVNNNASIRPSFSFARAAAGTKEASAEGETKEDDAEEELTDKIAEVQI